MIENYKCHVHSFDPYIEDAIFKTKRNSDKNLENSASLSISPNWMFHRIGITGSNDNKDTNIKIGSHLTLNEILDYTNMNKKVNFIALLLGTNFLYLISFKKID